MELSKVTITNFKGIEKKELEFKPRINIIKGENGKGKTSILEAIAIGLGGFVAGIEGVSTRHFSKDEIRKIYSKVGDGSYSKENIMPIEVYCEARVDGESYSWLRSRTSVQASRSTVNPRIICQKAEQLSNQVEKELPLLSYQSAARVWSQKRERNEDIFRNNYFRTVGYTDCLTEASNTKMLLYWCARMEQIAWKKGKEIAEYEAVKCAVALFMEKMESKKIYVAYDKQSEELLYHTDDRILPITALSAGYQSLIWMVFDLAYRMAVLNPFLMKNICKTKGIVLIDEIDMHLHPKWQWNIIDALHTVFPNVQFIVSTHSPIIIASSKISWLIDIEEEVKYGYSQYGLDINDTLQLFQESDGLPLVVKEKLEKFYHYIDEENLEQAKKALEILEQEVGESKPVTVEARVCYDIENMKFN